MPASAVKKLKNYQKQIHFKLKKNLVLYWFKTMKFYWFSSICKKKMQLFQDYQVLLRIAQAIEKFFDCHSN